MAIYNHIIKLISRVTVLVALLFFVACADEKVEPTAEVVTFDIADSQGWGEMSRGAALTTTNLCQKGFGVFAYYTENKSWNSYKTSAGAPNFINNSKVTSANNGTTWGYSPVKYWPHNQNDKVSFFAYAPYDSAKTIAGTMIDFEVNQTVSQQIDLVWSKSATTDLNKNTQKVNFKFQHALARIGFNLQASVTEISAAVTAKFTINRIILTSATDEVGTGDGPFYASGTLDLYNTGDVAAWSNCSDNNKYTLTSENFSEKNNTGLLLSLDTKNGTMQINAEDSYVMVIPQDLSSGGFNVLVDYQVDLIVKGSTYNTYENNCMGTVEIDLKSGNTYMINIIATLKDAKVEKDNVDIIKWGDGGDLILPGLLPEEGSN